MRVIVNVPICPLILRPACPGERVDEALFGMAAEVLDAPCPGWFRVRTHYGYTGYAEGRHLLGREAQLFLPRRAQAQGVVQEHLVDFRHIARQLIFEFSLVLRLGADNPEHELVLRHSLDIFMHPAGHPAADIRVTAFQYHTNPQFDHSVFRMPAPP